MLHSEEEMIREKIKFLDLMLAKRDYNPKAEVDIL